MAILIYVMVFVGSALMILNILAYIRYLRHILKKGYWEGGTQMLYFPLILLIMFFIGYVLVGTLGKPDIIMSGILFFGSVYVTIILYVLKTITARVEESEQLESQLRAAEESSRAKTAFLSNMSHEIRTPMNAIIGLNTLAQKNPDLPDLTREQLKKMEASSQHMMTLINDILDMSRIESGLLELKRDPFLFEDLMAQVNVIAQTQCDDKGLRYEHRLQGPVQPAYRGDEIKMKQVLINILGNAVKYTMEGVVSLEVQADPVENGRQRMIFIVRDTGIGIDQEFLPHLFDPFTQEDDSGTNRYGGSGLGMAITRSIVDLMEGEIEARSAKGKGTTISIRLDMEPISQEEAMEARKPANYGEEIAAEPTDPSEGMPNAGSEPAGKAAPAEEDEAASGEFSLDGRRILVAEDVELNAEILMDFLEMEDIEAHWACNGRIALEKFSGSDPGTYDAILMDLRMPEMDGLTATRAIRALSRPDAGDIPIIALTANAFNEDVRRCREAGMDAHLSKPVDSDMMFAELRRLIARREHKKPIEERQA